MPNHYMNNGRAGELRDAQHNTKSLVKICQPFYNSLERHIKSQNKYNHSVK